MTRLNAWIARPTSTGVSGFENCGVFVGEIPTKVSLAGIGAPVAKSRTWYMNAPLPGIDGALSVAVGRAVATDEVGATRSPFCGWFASEQPAIERSPTKAKMRAC